ncbi:hypothetical protein I7I51_03018 [Histoplasma capsulatum]|uniref:F-box domain-containing protein n=1 Tax=Ajellomyces capsulatus TaxID=5037 RepID=A0A8A1MJZ6_AJECA|nr:hypothetical protein I7I51_03018 [Histoplasma capsulatum]
MQANITALPVELLWQIAGHLDTTDIAHLVHTCTRFRSSIKPYLYETINLASEKGYLKALKLLTVVDKDSTLAGLIKTLEIGDLRKEDTKEVDEWVRTVGWETSPSADESVARLLSQLSSLRSFRLNHLHGEVHLAAFNFATLPTLTTLKVLAESLVSRQALINHLPPALECLYVKEASNEANQHTLPQLLIDYITAAAELKLVSIQSDTEYWSDKAELLDNACENCGVELELQYRELRGGREPWAFS